MSAAERAERMPRIGVRRSAPNSWGALLVLTCIVVLGAAVCGIAVQRFLVSRPVDLRARAQSIALRVEDLLARDVQRPAIATTNWESGNAMGYTAHFEAAVPAGFRPREFEQQLRDTLSDARATVTELPDQADGVRTYAIDTGGHDVAIVRLTGVEERQEVVDDSLPPARADEGNRIDLAYLEAPLPAAQVPSMTVRETPSRLASFAMELSGLDPDDLVEERYADPEELPLDSSDLLNDGQDSPIPSMRPPYTGPLRLAIIVDDGGYGGANTEAILAMPNTLTLSILPHTPFGSETARRAAALGFEVMLHMPMENVSGKITFPGQITVDMNAKQMKVLTDLALADVPGAVGINNHTGSKFTSDAAAMRTFLSLIKDRGYFFIDSRTAKTTCAYQVADEMEIPAAARDLFLDHESGPDYIRARFKEIIEIVKRQGSAIAICHFRRNTVPILQEMLPVFEQEGIRIVHASEMVQ